MESIFPHATYIDASHPEALTHALSQQEDLVIYHFESITDLSGYDFTNRHIVAIADTIKVSPAIEEKFAFIYHMPALRERPEDCALLLSYFSKQIKEELMINTHYEIDAARLDLSENIKSFKASIYVSWSLRI